jgi:hypothetical protein
MTRTWRGSIIDRQRQRDESGQVAQAEAAASRSRW